MCGARPPTEMIPDSTLSPKELTCLLIILSCRTSNCWHSQKSQMSGCACGLARARHWSFHIF